MEGAARPPGERPGVDGRAGSMGVPSRGLGGGELVLWRESPSHAALLPISRLRSCTPLWPQRQAHTRHLHLPPTPAMSLPSRRSPCCARWGGLLHSRSGGPTSPLLDTSSWSASSRTPGSSHVFSPPPDHGGQLVSPSLSPWLLMPRCPLTTTGLVVPTWPPPPLHALGDPGPWRVLLCRARWSVSTA